MSAVELGAFSAIANGDNTIPAAAAAMQIEPLNAERLLTALVAMDLLTRDGEHFQNCADVDRFLVAGKPTYAGPWMLFGKPRWQEWGKLTDHLRLREEDPSRVANHKALSSDSTARPHHRYSAFFLGQ